MRTSSAPSWIYTVAVITVVGEESGEKQTVVLNLHAWFLLSCGARYLETRELFRGELPTDRSSQFCTENPSNLNRLLVVVYRATETTGTH